MCLGMEDSMLTSTQMEVRWKLLETKSDKLGRAKKCQIMVKSLIYILVIEGKINIWSGTIGSR